MKCIILLILVSACSGQPTTKYREDSSCIIGEASLHSRLDVLTQELIKTKGELEEVKRDLTQRSEEMVELKRDIAERNEEVAQLKREAAQRNDQRFLSAFSARDLDFGSVRALHPKERLIFVRTTLNEGGHYNPQTGEYVCPVDGLYYFTLTVRSARLSKSMGTNGANAGIYHNQELYVDSQFANANIAPTRAAVTLSTVIQCQRGEKVWAACTYRGSRFNSITTVPANVFSGFLFAQSN